MREDLAALFSVKGRSLLAMSEGSRFFLGPNVWSGRGLFFKHRVQGVNRKRWVPHLATGDTSDTIE